MKRLLRVLGLFLVVVLIITLLLVGTCFVFKDKILEKVESNVAKNIGTDIKTSDLDLDPFTHFPYFTLLLEDLDIKGNDKKDFIKASYLELLIHPLSVFNEEIDISTLILNDGAVLLSKHNDKWNYAFANDANPTSTATSNQKDLQFSDLQFNNIELRVNDLDTKMTADIDIQDFKGSLSISDDITLAGKLNLIPQKIKMEDYLAIAKEKWIVHINVTSEEEQVKIDLLDIDFTENNISLKGVINENLDLDGTIEIGETDAILPWVPADYHTYIFPNAQYDFIINGKPSDPNGKIKIKTDDLNLDLIKDHDSVQLDGSVEATFLNTFQEDYLFTDGRLLMSKLALDKNDPSIESMTGTIRVRDLSLEYLDKEISIITDEISMDHGKCSVEKLGIHLEDSDLEFNGTIEKNQNTYSFTGGLLSDKIVASDFLSMMQDTTESTIKIIGEFDVDIGQLINNDWSGDKIKGKINYTEDILNYQVNLESFDGAIESDGSFKNTDELHFLCNSSFKNLKVEDMLDQLQNLGQEMITSDNLSGTLTGNAMLDFSFDEDLAIDKTKSHAMVAVKAESGRLQGFSMLEDFSKYIDIDDLRDIKFDNMTNYFEWKGDHLVIPVMFIKNNAANFLVSGYQNMDNELLYYLQINASDILAKKFGKKKRKAKKKGWWNMYYILEGDAEGFDVRSDKDKVRAGLNKSLIEKEEIFDKLVTVFGYTEVLQSLEDWEDM